MFVITDTAVFYLQLIRYLYDDFCTIRRDMIAEEILDREGSTYWLKYRENKPNPILTTGNTGFILNG